MSAETPDPVSHALEALVRRFSALISSVGSRHRLTQDDIDALFQDVRIRLWSARRDAARLAEMPSGYVYQTAMSVVLDRMRQHRLADQRLGPLDDDLAAPRDEVSDDIAHDDLVQQVEVALGALAAPRRTVVRLHLVGYARAEIAAMLGWSEAKTRSRRWELVMEGPNGSSDSQRLWDWAKARVAANMALGKANSFRNTK